MATGASPTLLETSAAVAFLVADHKHHAQLLAALAGNGLAGGAAYDALVAATALEHGLTLTTRDK